MWLIHEHNSYTSAIDKYWLFDDYESANVFIKEYVKENKNFLDMDILRELYDELYEQETDKITFDAYDQDKIENPKDIVYLQEDNYLVMTQVDNNNFARRP